MKFFVFSGLACSALPRVVHTPAFGNQSLSQVHGILRPLLQWPVEAGKRSRKAIDSAYNEYRKMIKALIQRDRIAYVYPMNRHLQAGRQFITPKAV
ncbi:MULTISPECIES: FCD domain-containing protein [unclassified Rhizobium]|uniref:FCD domain-containing protein n=1 Tax=unclassified Rhizobium TaxID=2613769 RepID=UPI00197F24B6|nr:MULTISPECIES: FCD domain-containing protein [unclassified Rhizobium]